MFGRELSFYKSYLVRWLTPGDTQVVRAEAGVPLHVLQAWLLARGWELACADALPLVAGDATVGSLLAAWGGSLLGPRVHALTVVDHAGQARLVFMFIEFGPRPSPARPRAAQVDSS